MIELRGAGTMDSNRQSDGQIRALGSAHTSGFTSTELLIVMAIITIIAAVLFPVFATAREKARQTTCVNNEKQMGMAMLQYCGDNDEQFPLTDGQQRNCWSQVIYPYIKSAGAFECPDNSDVENFNPLVGGVTWMGNSSWLAGATPVPPSYGMSNFVGAPYHINSNGHFPISLSQGGIQVPANKILVAERWGYHNGKYARGCTAAPDNQDGVGWKDWDSYTTASPYIYACELTVLHTKQSNFLFCDGHVKTLNPVLTTGVNGLPGMWGCMDKSTTTAPYSACTVGDINADNPDPSQTAEMWALVGASN